MRSAPILAALLASAALAGCAEPAASPSLPGEDRPMDAATGGSPVVVAAPGEAPHVHDHWQGRERVTLFEGEVDPASAEDAAFATAFSVLFGREARVGGTRWRLPEGAIVFEGTGRLELAAAPRSPATTSVALVYRPPGQDHQGPVALPAGETVAIEVAPAMADMPHAPASRWEFFFQPGAPGAMLGPFALRVEIVRTRDPLAYPPHPDRWGGADEAVLLDADVRASRPSSASRLAAAVAGGDAREEEIAPAPVPMETARLRVEVVVHEARASVGEVSGLGLAFRSADAGFASPAGDPAEGSWAERRLVWEIPVEMGMTDSPYAEESGWRLVLRPETRAVPSDAAPPCEGCADAEVAARVRVVALRGA